MAHTNISHKTVKPMKQVVYTMKTNTKSGKAVFSDNNLKPNLTFSNTDLNDSNQKVNPKNKIKSPAFTIYNFANGGVWQFGVTYNVYDGNICFSNYNSPVFVHNSTAENGYNAEVTSAWEPTNVTSYAHVAATQNWNQSYYDNQN